MSTKVKPRHFAPDGAPRRRDGSGPAPAADDPRRGAMLAAAYESFVEHGVSGATTDEIARRARVSKREIYRLFGSKEALFSALVRERAGAMRSALELAPPDGREAALEALERFGREFLGLLVQPTTVAVYRLAMAESGRLPELGRELDAAGRGTVWAALTGWMAEARARGALPVPDVERAAGSFMALLMGDLQVRLALGAAAAPEAGEVARRAALARAGFQRLWLG
jgi:AcrR family transcriptional regulator